MAVRLWRATRCAGGLDVKRLAAPQLRWASSSANGVEAPRKPAVPDRDSFTPPPPSPRNPQQVGYVAQAKEIPPPVVPDIDAGEPVPSFGTLPEAVKRDPNFQRAMAEWNKVFSAQSGPKSSDDTASAGTAADGALGLGPNATIGERAAATYPTSINNLADDPYGWDPRERQARQAPLWMLYEAERADTLLPSSEGVVARKRTDAHVKLVVAMRDEQGRAYATGRRKTAVARVFLKAGDGAIHVNSMPFVSYFKTLGQRKHALEPLVATQALGGLDIVTTVKGGGPNGQAGAIRHGIAKALARYDPYLKPVLRTLGLLHRDPRMVERKKPGQPKARKKFQWVKR